MRCAEKVAAAYRLGVADERERILAAIGIAPQDEPKHLHHFGPVETVCNYEGCDVRCDW